MRVADTQRPCRFSPTVITSHKALRWSPRLASYLTFEQVSSTPGPVAKEVGVVLGPNPWPRHDSTGLGLGAYLARKPTSLSTENYEQGWIETNV